MEIIRIKDGKIYAPLVLKWLKCKPEEKVRQEFICRLVNDYGFSFNQMEQELNLTERSKRGTGAARADITIWANANDKFKRKKALIVVECKSPSVTLHKEDCFQGYNYAAWTHAKFFVITNQKETHFYKINSEIAPSFITDLEEIYDIPNAQQAANYSDKTFHIVSPEGLLHREKEVDYLFDGIINNRIFNLTGVGGSGKTSLVFLCTDKHKNDFNEIAYVVVNNKIQDDIVEQLNKVVGLEFKEGENQIEKILQFLTNTFKSEKTNLMILDINETSDNEANTNFVETIIKNKNLLEGWHFLIISREKVDTRNRIPTDDLNINEDFEFLKELFETKAGNRYKNFSNLKGLFDTIFYNPLLTEQLGLYLNYEPKIKTLEEIKTILYGSDFREENMQGMSADRHDETIISFLKNLITYQKFADDEKLLLRHIVLWQPDYINYDVIADLLKGVFEPEKQLDKTLKNLTKRSILSNNNNEATLSYKLHGLLAESLREQIDIPNENYSPYLLNIARIINYNYYKFLPYVDCIGNSLCKYDIVHLYPVLPCIADIFQHYWKADYAELLYKKTIKIISIKNEYDENEVYKNDLASAFLHLGCLQATQLNDYQSAKSNIETSIMFWEKLSKQNPIYIRGLASACANLANLQQDYLEDYHSADLNYKKALKLYHQLSTKEDYYQECLAKVYLRYAHFQSDHLGDSKSSELNIKKAIDICKRLPTDEYQYQKCLASALNSLAHIQCEYLEDVKAAELNYKKSIELLEQLPKDNPECQNNLAIGYLNLANLQGSEGKYLDAKSTVSFSINIYKKLVEYNSLFIINLIHSEFVLAQTLFYNNNIEQAGKILEEINPMAKQCLAEKPKDSLTVKINNAIDNLIERIQQQSLT
ncbi:MAG: type I restriction enzyme HsdR N-terminal domain-containing protein [Bacteroidales bacterium]|nr:type I restriction enzyme HsdR N-terminal domain-containing protein [Bacteroidales bacterium]